LTPYHTRVSVTDRSIDHADGSAHDSDLWVVQAKISLLGGTPQKMCSSIDRPRTSFFTKTSPPVEANADHGLGSRGGPADHLTGSLLTN